MSNIANYLPITSPTLVFFTVLLIILVAPIIMSKLRIPHIIGMVLAGVCVGHYGFNILERDSSFELFGRVGLLYIMFLASLEMDLEGLKKNLRQVGAFGLLTFIIPAIITYIGGVSILGYSPLASLLLACIMSSNTLIAYPIVARFGLQKHYVTTLCVGATMISLFIALVVVAAIVGSFKGGGWGFWLLFIVKFFVYCAGMLYLVPHLTRWFLRRYSDAVMQFIFILSMMFLCAALSEIIGLEGIFGAFFSGLILNRFIPTLSPLMNRLEFIGNALFIPYFLIGVGMLINIGLLFEGGNIITTVVCIVFLGTIGKAIAAYASCFSFRMPWKHGHLLFGLTSAHAAGGIAMVMIGMKLQVAPGEFLIGDDMLNGVVIMILFTCIISTITTDKASRTIVLTEENVHDDNNGGDDEKILIPVKYPDTCDTLINLGIIMRNPSLNRGLVAINVVYDDADADVGQAKGRQLLDHVVQTANAADVKIQTQVRLATNIGNGIKHAFKEFDCSEIILGVHLHDNSSRVFWGEFAQSVFNGLSRQIIIARCTQPLPTLRALEVAVPSRAEYEPGFYRWLERLSRLAEGVGIRIIFHGRQESLDRIRQYTVSQHPNMRAEYIVMAKWKELITLAEDTPADHMLVIITARQGTVSYKAALDNLPNELTEHYHGTNLMIIFPDQYGTPPDAMTFATAQHTEQISAYQAVLNWIEKRRR